MNQVKINEITKTLWDYLDNIEHIKQTHNKLYVIEQERLKNYNHLLSRIYTHGIAPPDGMVLVPSEHLQHGLEYVSAIPTIMINTGDNNPVLADEISKWCFDTQALLAAAPKQEVKP